MACTRGWGQVAGSVFSKCFPSLLMAYHLISEKHIYVDTKVHKQINNYIYTCGRAKQCKTMGPYAPKVSHHRENGAPRHGPLAFQGRVVLHGIESGHSATSLTYSGFGTSLGCTARLTAKGSYWMANPDPRIKAKSSG